MYDVIMIKNIYTCINKGNQEINLAIKYRACGLILIKHIY